MQDDIAAATQDMNRRVSGYVTQCRDQLFDRRDSHQTLGTRADLQRIELA